MNLPRTGTAARRRRNRPAAGVLLLITWLAAGAAVAAETITHELTIPGPSLRPDEGGAWVEVDLPGSFLDVDLGAPMTPCIEIVIPIPGDARAIAADLEVYRELGVTLEAPLAPYRGERSTQRPDLPEIAPDGAIYGRDALWPAARARLVTSLDFSDGSRRVVVRVYPVRYNPVSGELRWVEQGRLILKLSREPAPAEGLSRERGLAAPAPQAEASAGAWSRVLLTEPGLRPAESPSVEGSPVEYVIIAPDAAMAEAWEPLAEWKTTCGYPAAVVTLDWIGEHYPNGADPAERVRLFLQDAYTNWNLRWVLIGADHPDVPVRYGRSRAYGSGGYTDIATDYYYACLEGNWDADGNGIFGQTAYLGAPGDSADTTPEVHVGRVSARTPAEVADYLEKYFTYTQTPSQDGYLDRILMLGEVLFDVQWKLTGRNGEPDCHLEECTREDCRLNSSGNPICAYSDGADDCLGVIEILRDSVDAPHELALLFERAEYYRETMPELTPLPVLESMSSVMDYISSGYSIVHQVGHGDRDRWAVGEGRLLTGDLVNLTNGTAGDYFIAYGVNCHSAAVDYDSFGEKMVMLPGDGAICYLGSTNADFPSAARKFVHGFYQFLLEAPGRTIGDAYFGSLGAQALTGSQIDSEGGLTRFLLYAQILLGEPGMLVWQATPGEMLVSLPDYPGLEVPLGTSRVRVAIAAAGGLAHAQVCLHKEGEVYSVGQLGAGAVEIELPFHPRSAGPFTVTVTSAGHIPETLDGTVVGTADDVALYAEGTTLRDDGAAGSDGNANGVIETGETVRIELAVGNAGSSAATEVSARLRLDAAAPAGVVVISDSLSSLGTIDAGGTGSDASAFLVGFSSTPPESVFGEADQIEVPFRLLLASGELEAEIHLTLTVTRPRITLSTNHRVDAGGGTQMWIGVANAGKGTASHLEAALATEDPGAIALTGPGRLGVHDLAPGDTALAGPFELSITSEEGGLLFCVIDTSGTPDDTLHMRRLRPAAPAAPAAPTLIGLLEAMQVEWEAPVLRAETGIYGYKIYRSPSPSGPFASVFPGILEGHRVMTDTDLGQLEQYSYYVAAVDSGGNMGDPSPIVSASTSPGIVSGWPNYLENYTEASPMICELDGFTGRGREIIFGGETIYAFHGDGSEVVNGDFADRTRGPFSIPSGDYMGDQFWGRAAAADIDADGAVEVLAVAFNHTNDPRNYPDARGELWCWGPGGRTPEWVYTFPAGIAWTTPTLADLDGDGQLEVLFCAGPTDQGSLYVLDAFGDPWVYADGNGRLVNLGGSNLYQSPAVGDIDGDDDPEIVIATRHSDGSKGAIWVIRPNGTRLPGFDGPEGLLFSDLGQATHTTASPTLCDVDGQPGAEIFIVTEYRLWCVTKGAVRLWYQGFSAGFNIRSYGLLPEAALGDIDGDDDIDVAVVDAGGKLWVIEGATGAMVNPFPLQLDADLKYGSCILANVDEDPEPEIIFGDNKQRIHAYRFDGEIARGFPIYFGGNFVQQSLAAWDIDLDGYQNLVVQVDKLQKLAVFDMSIAPFPEDETEQLRQNPWPMRHRDALNTGLLNMVPPVAVAVVLEAPQVTEAGEVRLAWSSGQDVLLFRVLRSSSEMPAPEVIAEVPGRDGVGVRLYGYLDTPPGPGVYVYRVDPVALDGGQELGPSRWVTVPGTAGVRFGIHGIAPSPLPAGGVARIAYGLPGVAGSDRLASLHIHDIQGRLVRALRSGPQAPGAQLAEWDGRDDRGRGLAAGLYLVRLDMEGRCETRRLLLIR